MVWLRSQEADLLSKRYEEFKEKQPKGEGSGPRRPRRRQSSEHRGSSAHVKYNVGSRKYGGDSDDDDDDGEEDGSVVFVGMDPAGSVSAAATEEEQEDSDENDVQYMGSNRESDYDQGKFPGDVATTGESKTGGGGGENVAKRNGDSDTVQDGDNCSEDSWEEVETADACSSESERDDSDDGDYDEGSVSEASDDLDEKSEAEEEEEDEEEKEKEEEDDDVQILYVKTVESSAGNGGTEAKICEERAASLSSNGEVGIEKDDDDVEIIDTETVESSAGNGGTKAKICEEMAAALSSKGEVGIEKDEDDDVEIIDRKTVESSAGNGGTEAKISEERDAELSSNGEVGIDKDDYDYDFEIIDAETAGSRAGSGRKEAGDEKVDELSSYNEEVGMEEAKQGVEDDEQHHITPSENSEDENELDRLWDEMANAPYENQDSSDIPKVPQEERGDDARRERRVGRFKRKAETDEGNDVGMERRGRKVEMVSETGEGDDVAKETRERTVEGGVETDKSGNEDSHGAGWWWAGEVTKVQEAVIGSSDPPISIDLVERENSDAAEGSCSSDQAKQKNSAAEQRRNQQSSWQPIGEQLKEVDVVNILARSVLGDAELPVEDDEAEEPPAEEQQQCVVRKISQDEQPAPPEKSEEQKELDSLWDEMALAQYENEDCPSVSEAPEQVDVSSPGVKADPFTLCRQGKHQLVVDDEIGLLCRYCSFVQTEIRYHVAPFAEKYYRTVNRGTSNKGEKEIPDGPADCDSDARLDHSRQCMLDEGTVWDIIPWIRKGLHKHQRDGFEFLWRNIGGDIRLNKLKEAECSSGLSGCVISHAPGTGKTRLTIRFLQTYMKKYPKCRPMIIVPCSMLLPWEAEFKSLEVPEPRHNLNDLKLTGKESVVATDLLKDIRDAHAVRWVKLYSWQRETGILLLSYTLFEELVGKGMRKKRKNQGDDSSPSKAKGKPVDERIRQVLLEVPGLMVLDEGHTARNESSLLWRALSKVKTGKRVILSGTPFQNNFEEFFNTLWLARPNFLDSISTFNWVSEKDRKRGRELTEARKKWQTMTKHLHKSTNDGVKDKQWKDLRALINPFVHVYNGGILQEKLPGLRTSVVILNPADLQKRLLTRVQTITQKLESEQERKNEGTTERKDPSQYFQKEHALSVASVHPYLLKNCSGVFQVAALADADELTRSKLDPDAGVKTKFLMELIKISGMINEKVLVFSQYLDPLRMIAEQLNARFEWTPDKDFLYMHGGLDVNQRQSVMKKFNDPSTDAKVFLASTKACSEGISLIGASRVVLLDVVWNPSVTRQAISRAYRLGQTKVVHVYNLITSGAIEEQKYSRQLRKDKLSDLVLYSAEGADSCRRESSRHLSEDEKDRVLEKMLDLVNLKDMFKNVIYQPKEDLAYN
ncbi:unnamed protein product [Linum trigynum]|uniref:Uncharacterized protein n=1 Tax=Linum trigynum TaxID=586398 RepID=A0AAV2DR64_9ROSI